MRSEAGAATGARPAGAEDRSAREADRALVAALAAGDEEAFAALVRRHHGAMVRLAQSSLGDREAAEEVAQDTWIAVLGGLARFEGRASLKTWIFRILLNKARTRSLRERRGQPFGALAEEGRAGLAVPAWRFAAADHPTAAGHWRDPPAPWGDPAEDLERAELRALIARNIAALPAGQRRVVELRDVAGWPAAEVCNVLGISDVHQRVLLHRARARLRAAIERYLRGEGDP